MLDIHSPIRNMPDGVGYSWPGFLGQNQRAAE